MDIADELIDLIAECESRTNYKPDAIWITKEMYLQLLRMAGNVEYTVPFKDGQYLGIFDGVKLYASGG